MRIEINNGRAYVYTPYSPEFVTKIKSIGGRKWESVQKCWSVPAVAVDSVRKIMLEVYKETDVSTCEKVDVGVNFGETKYGEKEAYRLLGKSIAIATGRDSGARVGEDVEVVLGEVYSGGSVKNWCSCVKAGSVVILRNVSKPLLDSLTEEDRKGLKISVLEPRVDRKALEEEKARLLVRLAEIEKLLA